MARRCATLDEVLEVVRECRTTGDPSTGTVTFANQPSDGATFKVTDDLYTVPPESATLTARTAAPGVGEYQIGANVSETAANFVAAVNDPTEAMNGLVMASRDGAVVTLGTAAEGPASRFAMETSEPANLVLSGERLTGGEDVVEFARLTACKLIGLECWGSKASDGHTYLTGHFCTVAAGGEQGPLNAKTIDKISASFGAVGTATQLDANFSTTRWGRMYLALFQSLLKFPIVGRRTLSRVPY